MQERKGVRQGGHADPCRGVLQVDGGKEGKQEEKELSSPGKRLDAGGRW